MVQQLYEYRFDPDVEWADVQAAIALALLAAECLHGETEVRLQATHATDAETRMCVINGDSDVGRDLNKVFCGFLQHEFGENAFTVCRTSGSREAAAGVV